MNRTLLAGVGVGLALAGLAVIVLGDDAIGAPYNPTKTGQADQLFLDTIHIERLKLADAGTQVVVTMRGSWPESTSLPDGGTKSVVQADLVGFEAGGAIKTTIEGFATGAGLTRFRALKDMEQ